MELVRINFFCLEPDLSGRSNVLVVTDHFTRYAQAFPTRDQQASIVAKTLVEKFFIHYGLPEGLNSNQGRDFESKLVKRLCKLLDIQKSRASPYHPQGDLSRSDLIGLCFWRRSNVGGITLLPGSMPIIEL